MRNKRSNIFFIGTETLSTENVAVFQNFGSEFRVKVFRLNLKSLERRIKNLKEDKLDTSEEERGLKELCKANK